MDSDLVELSPEE